MAKYDHINFVPPVSVSKAAKKALEWKDKYGDEVKGGTQVGWTRANQLSKREKLSPDTVKRMYRFFLRHEKNKTVDSKYKNEPWKDNGKVAWEIWGGDAGRTWATKLWKQMEKADLKTAKKTMTEEDYLASKGYGLAALGDPAMHAYHRRPSKAQKKRLEEMLGMKLNKWQKNRDKLREEYREKVKNGEIRPPTRIERLMQRAKGHPDKSSTQAARRILRKQGLWDDKKDKEYLATEILRLAEEINPYLNTPPTKLSRMMDKEQDEDKKELMKDALEAWRITTPGPFRKN